MPAGGTPGTVLVVDDDPAFRDVLTILLRGAGYAVETAANGRRALGLLRAAAPPCLIVLDLSMPVMDGPQFLDALRQDPALAGVPVLVTSARRDGQEAADALGAVGYLEKPVDLDALLRHVGLHCRRP